MKRPIFNFNSYRNQVLQEEAWLENLCLIGLLAAALVLLTINLDSLALRDWDEGTVAQVAKEIFEGTKEEQRWLFPTLWGQPYWNKPPLIHNLIALCYRLGGVNEAMSRLPGALLTAFSVPLLYGVGREIFSQRNPALFSALIYLTLLPVIRQGRLAMLDGGVLCFGILMVWCVLRSRRDLRWTLGIGISFGLLCLTKGMVGLLWLAIALGFLAWDTPRLLTTPYLWLGMIIGSFPMFSWYFAQWQHYQQDFIDIGIWEQSLKRIHKVVEDNQGHPWYYLLEILKYSVPWILIYPFGVQLAWEHRNWSWAKLILVWSAIYLVTISLMATKLPWYVLPVYPALALAGGAKLGEIVSLPNDENYPQFWLWGLSLLAIIAGFGCVIFQILQPQDLSLSIILGTFAVSCAIAALLFSHRDLEFIPVLFWGSYLTLLLFVLSPHWIWELNEAYPVKPVAAMIRLTVPTDSPIYTSFDYERPSLNFYSQHRIVSANIETLAQYWQQTEQPYLLIERQNLAQLQLQSPQTIGTAEPNWLLITKK